MDVTPFAAIVLPQGDMYGPAWMAAAGFLAGYGGQTRIGYTHDIKAWWIFCEANGPLPPLDAKRAHIELYIRSLEEKGYAPPSSRPPSMPAYPCGMSKRPPATPTPAPRRGTTGTANPSTATPPTSSPPSSPGQPTAGR